MVRRELAPLFRILGLVDVVEADDGVSASMAVQELLSSGEVAVILVQKSLLRASRLPAEVYSSTYPVVVEIPDEPGDLEVEPRDYYRDLVRKFVGYEIHLG